MPTARQPADTIRQDTLLSPKQLRFIDEYLIDLNGTAAAVRAGYSPKSARTSAQVNMLNAALQAVLRERQRVDATRLRMTRQGVIQRILEGIEMAREMGRPDVMIRGWTDIARMLGMYAPERHQVEVASTAGKAMAARLEAMSDTELAVLARG